MGASAGFEHEEGDSLLDEQTDDNGPPLDDGSVPRRHPETRLEHDETHDGDRAIAIFRALRGERKKERKWIRKWGSETRPVGDAGYSKRTFSSLSRKRNRGRPR